MMRKKHEQTVLATAGLLVLFATGCSEEEQGEGTLGVEVWGEEFIESGIPAEEFADGWAITFERFLLNLGAIEVAQEGEDPALVSSGFRVWDLAAASGPQKIAEVTAPAGTYSHTAYTLAPATAQSQPGNASAEDVQLLVEHGWSVFVEGRAEKGSESKHFAWGFSPRTAYDPCHSVARLSEGGQVAVQITIHGDHLFYDDAVSETPVLRFEEIASADTDGDGEVTLEELAARDIRALPNYGVGSLDIHDLRGYVEHMVTTVGHIDGEGHCTFQ